MNKDRITYEILEDGYMLFLDGKAWIKQHTEHVFNPDKTLEENAVLHIEEICKPVEETPSKDEQIAQLQEQIAQLQEQVNSLVGA